MANYEQLQQFIDARVYDNNNNAITGSGLNYVLNRMVEILGNGFLFFGVIDPTSSVLMPDTNVFYVGFEGTYGQFDSQTYTVGPGEIGFFAYDGTWHVGIGQVGSGGGGGGGGSFDYEKLQLYLNINMTNRNRQTVSLRYNVGTAEVPDYENLGNVAFELAETTGWAGLIDGYSYYYLRAKLQQTKPQNNFPLKADQNDSLKAPSRVIDELWIDSTAYTPQQIQAMRVNRLLVNYDDNGDTVCEFRIIVPSNLSDLTQPWDVVIGYREVVTSSNRPSRVIFNASKTVWAVINWNNTLVAGGEYINHSDSEGTSSPFLDDTGKITDLNYAPTVQTCLELEKKVQSSTLDGLEALTDSAYSNLPSVDSRTLYITY